MTTRTAAQVGSSGVASWQTESSSVSAGEKATNPVGAGVSVAAALTPASESAPTDSHSPKPAQLFSMDADEFGDDGWGCDSPSAVLSNPMDESERVAVQSAAKEDDDFGWAEDDFAMDASVSTANQEVRQETVTPVGADQTTTSSATFTSVTSFSSPSTAIGSTSFRSSHDAGQAWSPSRPSLIATEDTKQTTDASAALQDQGQAAPALAESKTEESRADDCSPTVAEEFQIPTVDTPTTAAAAGEFWEDEVGDDDLFDHDDHADEEWDETIRDTSQEQGLVAAQSAETPSVAEATVAPSTFVVESIRNQDELDLFAEDSVVKENEPTHQEASLVAHSHEETTSLDASYHESAAHQGWPSEVVSNDPCTVQSHDQSGSTENYTEESSLHFHQQQTHGVSFAEEQSVATFEPESARLIEQDDAQMEHPPAVGNANVFDTETSSANDGAHGHNDYLTKSSVSWQGDTALTNDTEKSHEVASEHVYPPRKTLDSEDACEEDGSADEYRGDSASLFSGGGQSFSSFSGVSGRGLPPYGFQSSFTAPASEASSTEPGMRDMDGSSIRSFGVSSAGATFGGSERVSESAFSDGTASETPSIVDSSNASTAFGTDFPSVSEGQFSAPGTTFGGSDNVSDGQFSDGNASETTSVSESITHTMAGFVSEYQPSTGHYVTETIAESPNPFSCDSMEGDDDSHEFDSTGVTTATTASNLFESTPEVSSYTQTSFSFSHEDNSSNLSSHAEEQAVTAPESKSSAGTGEIQSAASLFGSSDMASGSPFGNFAAEPVASTLPPSAPMVVEHDLPTSDASDLFGSSSAQSDSAFGGTASQASAFGYSTASYGQVSFCSMLMLGPQFANF